MKCPVPGCKTLIRDWMVMCSAHWYRVPWQTREKVWDAYRRHRGSPEHLAALREAYASVLPVEDDSEYADRVY